MTSGTDDRTIIEKRIGEVLEAKAAGDLERATRLAEKLQVEYASSGAAAGLLASLYFEQDMYENAAKFYGITIQLSPRSERASLGLFHSLWELGDTDEAFEEMKRFVAVSPSEEYKRILKEILEQEDGPHTQGEA